MKQINISNTLCFPRLGRFRPALSYEFELELLTHTMEMQNRFYGLGMIDMRRIAFELAEKNNMTNPFNKHWETGVRLHYTNQLQPLDHLRGHHRDCQ